MIRAKGIMARAKDDLYVAPHRLRHVTLNANVSWCTAIFSRPQEAIGEKISVDTVT